MTHERVGGFPQPPDSREVVGKLLRQAFPLGLGSFEGLTSLVERGGPALVSPLKLGDREPSESCPIDGRTVI